MQYRKAFTLIELLVVIAIIAILAAILFPVFAQAKAQAKSAVELSGTKEMGLANIMYTNDYDDAYSFALREDWDESWTLTTQPYVKNLGILRSPFDGNQNFNSADGWLAGWTGITQSMSANGYFHPQGNPITTNCGCSQACVNGGVLVFEAQPDVCGGWIQPMNKSTTAVTQPAGTIMLGYKYNTDVVNAGGLGNLTAFGVGTGFGCLRCYGQYEWDSPIELPDGTLPVQNTTTTKYPTGSNGSVSLTPAGKSNFVLADGHAKLMTAAQTDPDPVNLPLSNMWDADR